ncbi:MAG: hypothetical protein ACJAQ0_001153 [Dasania sp.]|jgi:hypothetical protein
MLSIIGLRIIFNHYSIKHYKIGLNQIYLSVQC